MISWKLQIRLGTKIGKEGRGEAGGRHGEGQELAEEEHEQQTPRILLLDLRGDHGARKPHMGMQRRVYIYAY